MEVEVDCEDFGELWLESNGNDLQIGKMEHFTFMLCKIPWDPWSCMVHLPTNWSHENQALNPRNGLRARSHSIFACIQGKNAIAIHGCYMDPSNLQQYLPTSRSNPDIGDKLIPPLMTGILLWWVYKLQRSWVDDHPYHRKTMGVDRPQHISYLINHMLWQSIINP